VAAYTYLLEIVKKDVAGNFSVAELRVDTDYTSVSTGSNNTEFTVDGVSLGPVAPTLYSSTGPDRGTATLQNGAVVQPGVMSFFIGADEYFILQGSGGAALPGSGHIDPNRVTDVVITNKLEMTGAAHTWIQFKVFDQTMTTYQGEALRVTAGVLAVENVFVFDDDPVFQLSPSGGVETGLDPEAWAGAVPLNLDFTATTTENLVTVNYTTATGSGSFDAIATTYYTRTYYIPQNGNVDLSTITGVTSVVETTTPVNGSSYDAFGLNSDRFLQTGDSGDNLLFGDIGHDEINGRSGADTLFGDAGNDLLRGGKGSDTIYGGSGTDNLIGDGGNDKMYGGMNDDALLGGKGNDALRGGGGNDIMNGNGGTDILWGDRGDDFLIGNKGKDTLIGGAGNDVLKGSDGKDILKGQAGNDRLNGGNGADQMTGGGGVDTFVIRSDGKTDTITDFENGTDLIDIDVAFAALTITNGGAGEVLITHSGETLVVQDDGAGLLTAADFSAADFL
jgi:Ca2+-binding RTX toxin-like protein